MKPLDGATVEIIRNYLNSAAEQMRRTLVRAAFNPVIYEVLDFGISIYGPDLELIAEAPGITSFLGANDFAIHKGVDYVGRENLNPGDVVMLNYPYWSSAHAYDAMLFAPVFRDGVSGPAAYLAVRAHWMDLGAKAPGYVLDATDMHQEGLIFPGTKVVKAGTIDQELVEIIRFNSRMPDEVIGDFHAQLAAIRTGERQLHLIWEKFGGERIDQAVAQIIEHGEAAARKAVGELPDGSWTAVDWLDDDGVTSDMIRMQVTVTIDGENMSFDFAGSSDAVAGPVNMPFGATESMTKSIFKSLTTPHSTSNAGHYRPLECKAEPGTLFHAVYPAATFTLWTQIVAFDLVIKALAQGVPGLAASSGGDEPGFMAVGRDHRTAKTYVVSNNEGIGWGATPRHDGANAQQHMSCGVVRNTPIEVLEHKSSIFHHRLELRRDSAGAGQFRGGVGVVREVSFLADGEVLSMKKKTKTTPWALHGGREPAWSNGMVLWPGTDREQRVGMYRATMRAGDRFVNYTAGGGGWGNPLDRDPEAVVTDVLDGYVSSEAAADIYGVVIHADHTWSASPERINHRSTS